MHAADAAAAGRARCPPWLRRPAPWGRRRSATPRPSAGTSARGRPRAICFRCCRPSTPRSWCDRSVARGSCRSTSSSSGPKRTALEPGELVVEVVVALPKGPQEFMKVGRAQRDGHRDREPRARRRPRSPEGRGGLGRADGHPRARRGAVGRGQRGRPRRRRRSSAGGVAAEVRPIDDHRSTADVPAACGRGDGARARCSEWRPRERALPADDQRQPTTTSPTRGWARACSTCSASGSGCRGRRVRASRASAGRARWSSTIRLVCSCLVLAASAVGSRDHDGRGPHDDGTLSDVQQAFIAEGAVQCGFCTPGLDRRRARPARAQPDARLARDP